MADANLAHIASGFWCWACDYRSSVWDWSYCQRRYGR